LIAGLFFDFAFGMGLGSAILGELADLTSNYVFKVCAFFL
jgi:hypothetical protein